MLIGVKPEDKDLSEAHPQYEEYKRRVPALVPSVTRHLKRDVRVQTA